MIRYFIKLIVVLCLVSSLFTCSSKNDKSLSIDFSTDSSSIVFSNIDQAGLLQLKDTLLGDSVLNNIISVLQTPSEKDTTIREMPVLGKISIKDNDIVFTPEAPFIKGSDYLVITYLNASFGNAEKILQTKLSYGIKPIQKLLTR